MDTRFIKPHNPSQRVTQCSMLDTFASGAGMAFLAFCYTERLDADRLAHALAHVLSDFAVFAGRLSFRDGEWYIDPCSPGVRFELAHSHQSSRALGEAAHRNHSHLVCPKLSVSDVVKGREPAFAVRLTQTPDGSVLGLAFQHTIGDMQSLMLFMRAWACAYSGRAYPLPLAVAERDAYLTESVPVPASALSLKYASWRRVAAVVAYYVTHPGRRLMLRFSWSELDQICRAASRETAVSINDALCAHLITTLRRLQHYDGPSLIAIPFNFRKRLGLPINLLGNLADLVATSIEPGDDIALIAARMRDRLAAFESGTLGHHQLMKLKATRPRRTDLLRYWMQDLAPWHGHWMITNVSAFNVYKLAFGDSRPAYVHVRNAEKVLLSWFGCIAEQPDNLGLELTVWLPFGLAGRLAREMARPAADVLRDNALAQRGVSSRQCA